MAAINFTVTSTGNPQTKYTKWYATPDNGDKGFHVGYTTQYSDGDGAHTGLNTVKFLSELPRLYYDRTAAAQNKAVGLWAHFMWPTAVAESSGGHHLIVNSYDRARFTFGFYQLAAHTPNDNLILLFRKLLSLPKADTYFPDLKLVGGTVHRVVNGENKSLETEVSVLRPNGKTETQIVGFMNYLNPDTHTIGNTEVINAAKLQHWFISDPEAIKASVEVAQVIMRAKVKRLADRYELKGKDVRLAIWASDIIHHGRAASGELAAALAKPTLNAQLDALYHVGNTNSAYDSRRDTVRAKIDVLMDEGVFDGVTLGDGKLPL